MASVPAPSPAPTTEADPRSSRAAALADRHAPALYLLGLSVTGDPEQARATVADVIGDACREPERPGPVDHHEVRRQLARHTFSRCAADAGRARFDPAVRPLEFEGLMAWLGTLSTYQRAAIALCVYGDHRAWQAAAVLNVSTATVHELLFWSLQDLAHWARAATPGRGPARR